MNAVDGSDHFDKPTQGGVKLLGQHTDEDCDENPPYDTVPLTTWIVAVTAEQSPSLLTVILDTNPASWSLLAPTLPFSAAIANLLVFINAHLAANYTNKVAVVASHCDKAQWLYPSPTVQRRPRSHRAPPVADAPLSNLSNGPSLDLHPPPASADTGHKYRPFRLVEEELLRNLTALIASAAPEAVAATTSTMIAGALTLALAHINREALRYAESVIGTTSGPDASLLPSAVEGSSTNALQSRILLISASPTTDLAHQYIPIMNAIFACQRLSIPIDILQLPLSSGQKPPRSAIATPRPTPSSESTVFLQQAADATNGIFIPAQLPRSSSSTHATPNPASQAFLTYLLSSFLSSPQTRATHLILPTRIDVDFRAACFCHRNVVSVGFVCSICLSIFCSVPENGDCLTCGTHLTVGRYGSRPVVVPKKSKKKQSQLRR